MRLTPSRRLIFLLRPCFVDDKISSLKIGAIEGSDSLLSLLRAGHFHKAEPSRSARIAVGYHVCGFDAAVLGKQLMQILVGC